MSPRCRAGDLSSESNSDTAPPIGYRASKRFSAAFALVRSRLRNGKAKRGWVAVYGLWIGIRYGTEVRPSMATVSGTWGPTGKEGDKTT